MGAARVEMYRKSTRFDRAGEGNILSGTPIQVATETTSTTATTAGSRITAALGAGVKGFASIVVDEDCYVSIGADPTAAAATSFLVKANVARELPITTGEKISFKDVA